MMMHCERSTRRLSPRVSVALSRIPSSKLPKRVGGLFDFIKQQNRQLELVGVPLIQRFLREQGMGLAVTQIARRRADQFGDFMGVLELGAINLDASAGVSEERFRESFHDARLARTGWPKKKQIADRASGGVQSGEKHLVDFDDLLNGGILADDFAAKSAFKVAGVALRRLGSRTVLAVVFIVLAPVSQVPRSQCRGDGKFPGMTNFVTALSIPAKQLR